MGVVNFATAGSSMRPTPRAGQPKGPAVPMQLIELARMFPSARVRGDAAIDLREAISDSRAAAPGSLFFCVPGERADGHDFAGDALARGASALVVER